MWEVNFRVICGFLSYDFKGWYACVDYLLNLCLSSHRLRLPSVSWWQCWSWRMSLELIPPTSDTFSAWYEILQQHVFYNYSLLICTKKIFGFKISSTKFWQFFKKLSRIGAKERWGSEMQEKEGHRGPIL